MQFDIRIVVEADGVPNAITPEAIAKGTIIAVTPKQQSVISGSKVPGSNPQSGIQGSQFQKTETGKVP